MARQPRGSRTSRAKSSVRVDMSNISKAFEPSQEYAIRVTECSLEEGTKAPYFNLKLQGLEGGEYENSVMYHRASTGEASLWRLRPLLEALGFEIPEGPLDLDASDFVGKTAMCSTYLDRYDGGSSVKPDEFWELGDGEGDEGAGDTADFDLDELDDDQIEALAEAMDVKGRNVAAKKKALAKLDVEELAEAFAELGDGDEDGKDAGDEAEFNLDDLSDKEVLELAAHLELTQKTAKRARPALAKMDQEEVAEAWAELNDEEPEKEEPKKSGKASGKSKKDEEPVTEEQVQEMNEDELEAVVEQFDLDVDLSEFKTLRKMKNAVIDAMEEGGHFD